MHQPLAHISQTLFEHEVFQLRQHGTQARIACVMLVMATRYCLVNFLFKTAKINECFTLLIAT